MHVKKSLIFMFIFASSTSVLCNGSSSVSSEKINSASAFNISVIHINDFHARFEETSSSGGNCKGEECIGGFSRLYSSIRRELDEKPYSVLLNAGDNFEGTFWYIIGKWNVTQQFMNKLPFDATTLGNHEFDDGIDGLVPFLKALKYPVVVSNIDDKFEPEIRGLYKKSTVVERNGRKIGIIGVILSTVDEIANTENLKFHSESASVNEEAERLVREENVFTNIVLSHAGYDVDQKIAANASRKISLIVGGHTHSFLYTGENPPGPDVPEGPYPTVVTSGHGKSVLVTQASSYCKYFGNIQVFLDEEGEVVDYSGRPIFLDADFPQDAQINEELLPWKKLVDAQGNKVLGSTLVTLDMSNCKFEECTAGNFVADAMVYSVMDKAEKGSWTFAAIAAVGPAGIRTSLEAGNITYSDLWTAHPFKNTFIVGELKGKHIKDMLEFASLPLSEGSSALRLLQVSGIQAVINSSRSEGERIESVKVRCRACQIPSYKDLEQDETYRIIVSSYIMSGGDGHTAITDNIDVILNGTELDIDIYSRYLKDKSPVYQEIEGRLVIY